MELTNRIRKMVASLGSARSRKEEGCFVAEGTKCVADTWGHFRCRYLIAVDEWVKQYEGMCSGADVCVAKRADMERMTQLTTPPQVIAVYDIPEPVSDGTEPVNGLVIALDRVQDPGNLGTIIRVADWFGVTTLLCSRDTVDVFNPKVVQATMGAIARVNVVYCDLVDAISRNHGVPVYGTFLDGDSIYSTSLSGRGIVVMGNEGHGISDEVGRLVTHRLLIPSFPPDRPTSESLNVGMATAITIAEFRRRQS